MARAQYEIAIGGDAGPLLELAASHMTRALELRPKWFFAELSLAEATSLMARDTLEKKRSPEPALLRARSILQGMSKSGQDHPNVFNARGNLDLSAARWAVMEGNRAEAAIASARETIEAGLRLYPKDADLLLTAAQVELFAAENEAETREERARARALELAGRGLAWAAKLRAINETQPRFAAVQGALYLVAAKTSPSAEERKEAARTAEALLTEALVGNRFLKRRFGPLLIEARGMVESLRP